MAIILVRFIGLFFYYFVRVWSIKYIYLGKMQFTFSVFLIIYSHLSLFWHSIFKRFRLKWSLTCTKSRFIMKWSQKCVIFLSRTICWMALILSLFVGICSIISLDFDENNLIQRKYSALSRYIKAKKKFSFWYFLFICSHNEIWLKLSHIPGRKKVEFSFWE